MNSMEQIAAGIEAEVFAWSEKLRRLDPDTVRTKPTPERWSISEVMGHLVDSACNNHQRFVRGQFCDELQFPKYEQNQWVAAAGYQDFSWETLINLWTDYNRLIAAVIRKIPDAKLKTNCTVGSYGPCTLEFLVTDYLDHMRHHLSKLEERLAHLA